MQKSIEKLQSDACVCVCVVCRGELMDRTSDLV